VKRYDIVIPSIECIVAMQIFERAPKPFEKEYSKLMGRKIGIQEQLRRMLSFLKERAVGLTRNRFDPIDYDRLIKILDTNDPLVLSSCIDILFDMGITTAEWRNGRRVFRIKAEAFNTVGSMYGKLEEYAALG
jgi:hypothetical protein